MATKKVVENQSNAFGVASLVCSILSWLVFGIILAPLGIIFGAVSLSRREKNCGLALAGIIVGSIALLVLLVAMAMWATAVKML